MTYMFEDPLGTIVCDGVDVSPTGSAGGVNTLSMKCIIPFDAMTSGSITVALPIFTVPSVTVK